MVLHRDAPRELPDLRPSAAHLEDVCVARRGRSTRAGIAICPVPEPLPAERRRRLALLRGRQVHDDLEGGRRGHLEPLRAAKLVERGFVPLDDTLVPCRDEHCHLFLGAFLLDEDAARTGSPAGRGGSDPLHGERQREPGPRAAGDHQGTVVGRHGPPVRAAVSALEEYRHGDAAAGGLGGQAAGKATAGLDVKGHDGLGLADQLVAVGKAADGERVGGEAVQAERQEAEEDVLARLPEHEGPDGDIDAEGVVGDAGDGRAAADTVVEVGLHLGIGPGRAVEGGGDEEVISAGVNLFSMWAGTR